MSASSGESVYCNFLMSFEYAFLKRIFLRGKIKLLKEVNDREVKANFEKKAVLAIDSLDRVYMSYVCKCVEFIYMYMAELIVILC